jgi:hypothetical protein
MAVKKSKRVEERESVSSVPVMKSQKTKESKWIMVGWGLLLFGGLGHVLPEQMAPLMKWSLWGVSLQMAVGVGSVILALNFLLED